VKVKSPPIGQHTAVQKIKITEEVLAIPIICSRCNYSWNYTGNHQYVATCPNCRTKISIQKNCVKSTQNETPTIMEKEEEEKKNPLTNLRNGEPV
jgi:hypothetical protein